jgi:protein-disulfide isomerase
MPVPVWGVLGYGFFLILLSFAFLESADKKRIWMLLFLTALFFSVYSLYLAYILKFQIKVSCIVCIAGYAINFTLLYLVWIIRKRFPEAGSGFFQSLKKDIQFFWQPGKKKKIVIILIVAVPLVLPAVFPQYWVFEMPQLSSDVPTGITEDGAPWIGAEDPELVITEYTDYLCFHCKKKHAYLRQIVAKNPDKIRLVHRHFPIVPELNPIVEKALYPGSGKLAIAAAYAATQDRFWQMNDLLYDLPRNMTSLNIRDLAEKSGVGFEGLAASLANKPLYDKIRKDILKGIKLGVTGTPAYEINGRLYQGQIPMKKIMDALS